jgi:hypothetical protein
MIIHPWFRPLQGGELKQAAFRGVLVIAGFALFWKASGVLSLLGIVVVLFALGYRAVLAVFSMWRRMFRSSGESRGGS